MMTRFVAVSLGCFLAMGVACVGAPIAGAQATSSAAAGVGAPAAPDDGWPQTVQNGDDTITVYQPEVESWNDNQLQARAAVSVTTKVNPQATYGVVFFSARTEVDRAAKLVAFADMKVDKVSFPRPSQGGDDWQQVITGSLPNWPSSMALDRLQADLAVTKAEIKTQQKVAVKNDPPRILFSSGPALLVLIDGTPVPRAVEGTGLTRIINTRALILLDPTSGKYYLYLANHWEEARDISGPWARSADPPASLEKAKEAAVQSEQVDLLDSGADDSKDAGPVAVTVSTTSAELIRTNGKPDMQPIDGTQLLVCKNSEDDLFLFLQDQKYYVLLNGRWFRSPSIENGPWEFVPGAQLPADFSKIPENHPKGTVLASVPGTTQSQEAIISNSVPQTATVQRSEATADVKYDQDPKFEGIEGTPLQYAVNSPHPVIQVDAKSFYSVQNGVWFVASASTGPWGVADSIPAVVYTIPPSCPIHYVTYVRVYGATPEVVYVGYTPGYYDSLIGVDETVVYGTGWVYRPWIGAVWYGPPVTWGVGIRYGWYAGGWGWGPRWASGPAFRPWWGPSWGLGPRWWGPGGWHGGATINMNVYNHWSNRVVVNNTNITRNRTVVNNRTTRPDDRAERVGGRGTESPREGTGEHMGERATEATGAKENRENDHYAGRDGNVYKRGDDGGWERNDGDRWSKVEKEETTRSLGRSEGARGLGESHMREGAGGGGGRSRR